MPRISLLAKIDSFAWCGACRKRSHSSIPTSRPCIAWMALCRITISWLTISSSAVVSPPPLPQRNVSCMPRAWSSCMSATLSPMCKLARSYDVVDHEAVSELRNSHGTEQTVPNEDIGEWQGLPKSIGITQSLYNFFWNKSCDVSQERCSHCEHQHVSKPASDSIALRPYVRTYIAVA